MKKESKTPRDENGDPHGYWELYWRGNLWYKGCYIHGEKHGIWIWYKNDGHLNYKQYYIS